MRQVKALPNKRVGILVSYHFDWKTIEGISRVLNEVQGSEGVTLEESHDHQQTRTGAARAVERVREKRGRSDQGIEM